MKRILTQLSLCLLCLISSTFALAAIETYRLDPMHTAILWHINHFGFSNPSGKWYANGTLMLDSAKPQNSKVTVTIRVADIVTGIPELDKHLKSKAFFDVGQFPVALFTSDGITRTGANTANVHGILTLHGVAKPVILNVKLNKMGENPLSNKMSAGFSATTQIKRSDFGMNTLVPGLSDVVMINIEAEATKEK